MESLGLRKSHADSDKNMDEKNNMSPRRWSWSAGKNWRAEVRVHSRHSQEAGHCLHPCGFVRLWLWWTKCWNWCRCDGARVGQANWGKVTVLVFDGLITIEALVGATAENKHVYNYIFIEWHTVHLVTFRQIQLDCTNTFWRHHMNSTRLWSV